MKKYLKILLIPVVLLVLELATHYYLFHSLIDESTPLILLSCIAIGLLIQFVLSFFKPGAGRVLLGVVLAILGVYFSAVMVYYHVFHTFFIWNTIGLAGDVTAFYREAWEGIKESWYKILTAFLPLVLVIVFRKKIDLSGSKEVKLAALLMSVLAIGGIVLISNTETNRSIINHFQEDSTSTYYRFGVLGSTNVDFSQMIFGVEEEQIINPYANQTVADIGKPDVAMSESKVILKNVLDIDWETMIANTTNSAIREMHEYFSTVTATEKNDYTGYFEGKNLIFLTLEGFSYKAISQQLTPTLYKMLNEGFVFTNFYDGMWGGSTATGEYSNITGNFYTSASVLPNSAGKLQYSAIGNMFSREGYKVYSYHNGSYDFYSRDQAYPAFGLDNYKAVDKGLILKHYIWPNSDIEMAEATAGDYMNSDEPFLAYYMTISGHTNYTWKGNNMAKKHREEVQVLDNSELVKGFVATQLEVEGALTYLVEQLEASGQLENTVFAMCCDHYPYGLKDYALAELYGLDETNIRANLELYHNAFILWSASMEAPIVVDEPCAAYDMVPTLANLFGLEYDSRLITGTDILSSKENVAIINTMTTEGGSWNWKTRQGTYYSVKKVFEPSENCTLTTQEEIDAYVAATNARVASMKKYSFWIHEKNYYAYVFNKDWSLKYPLENGE